MQDNLIFYFIIYSFLGWCLESAYKTIILKKLVNSGFLYGPFCPMYGIGALLMILIGKNSNNIIVIFLLAFVLFSVWEYIVAIILEKLFKTKYWDYSDLKFNIKGRVCLKNSIYWGILGVLLMFVIQPGIEYMTNLIPANTLRIINIVLCIGILLDTTITIYRIMFIDKKIRQVFELGDTIKDKIKEIKEIDYKEKLSRENAQKFVDELKTKQAILKFTLYKRIARLKNAFPEMNSENISKFMKQKIELSELKEKIKKLKDKKLVK